MVPGSHSSTSSPPSHTGLTTRGTRCRKRPALHLYDLATAQLSIEFQRVSNDRPRSLWAKQALDDDLLVLERLVVLEEPPQLDEQVRGQLRFVRVAGKRRVVHA